MAENKHSTSFFFNEEKKITSIELCSLPTPGPLLGFGRAKGPFPILAHIAYLLKALSSLFFLPLALYLVYSFTLTEQA